MKETASALTSGDPHIWMIRTSDNVLSGPYTQEQLIQLVEEEKLELTDEICRGNSYWIYLHEEQEVKKHLGIEVPAALVEPEEPTQTETDSIISRRAEPSHHHNPLHGSQQAAAMGARMQRNSTMSAESSKPESRLESPVEGSIEAKKEYTPVVENEDTDSDLRASLDQDAGSSEESRESVHSVQSHQSPQSDDEFASDDGVPELAVSADSIEDHTAVLNNRAFREFRPREQAATSSVSGTSLTDASPQSVMGSSQVTVSPSIPQVEGVSVSHGDDLETSWHIWIYIGIGFAVVFVGIYFLWRHFLV